jgi:hypothetical protein
MASLEKPPGKTAWKNQGNQGNRWENEEIAGRNPWKNINRGKHIEKNKDLKLNGEQRPLGFGAKRFARG